MGYSPRGHKELTCLNNSTHIKGRQEESESEERRGDLLMETGQSDTVSSFEDGGGSHVPRNTSDL